MDILMVCLLYSSAVVVREKLHFCFRSWWWKPISLDPAIHSTELKSSASSVNAPICSRLLLVHFTTT